MELFPVIRNVVIIQALIEKKFNFYSDFHEGYLKILSFQHFIGDILSDLVMIVLQNFIKLLN